MDVGTKTCPLDLALSDNPAYGASHFDDLLLNFGLLKGDFLLNTGGNQSAHNPMSESDVPLAPERQSSAPSVGPLSQDQNSQPVIPIGCEDVKLFFERPLFYEATFSEELYSTAAKNDKFLVYFPIGIWNHGSKFCYLNSIVQALANIPLFALGAVCNFPSKQGSLLNAIYQIYKHIWVRITDLKNTNRPSMLYADEIRICYAEKHSDQFDPTKQHDAEEFLNNLIVNLEFEALANYDGLEEHDFLIKLFSGYILFPDGTKETFRTLRLSIEDERIDSIRTALLHHLLIVKPPRPTRPVPNFTNTVVVPQTSTTSYSESTKPPSNMVESRSDSTGSPKSSNNISPPLVSLYSSEPCSTAVSSHKNAFPSSEYPTTHGSPALNRSSSIYLCSSSFSHENNFLLKHSPFEKKSTFPKISSITVPHKDTLGPTLSVPILLKTTSSTISTKVDSERSRGNCRIEEITSIPSPALGIVPESSEEPRCGGILTMEISPIANSVRLNDLPFDSDAQTRFSSSYAKEDGNDQNINSVADQVPQFRTEDVTIHDGKSCTANVSQTIVMQENNPHQSFGNVEDLTTVIPQDLSINTTAKRNKKLHFSATDVVHEERLTIPEKTVESCAFRINSLPSGRSNHFTMPIRIYADHEVKSASRLNAETNSAFEEALACDANLNADSLQCDISSYNLNSKNFRKIYTPDILCVSLDRHHFDYTFNLKILPAEDLVIPAVVRAPEGTTRHAFYKLMSIVQYVPMGPTSGHYYTYVKTGRGSGYMLNDHLVSAVDNEAFDLAANGGRSSIFVYVRLPDSLQQASCSN